jgi:hypothetical protein
MESELTRYLSQLGDRAVRNVKSSLETGRLFLAYSVKRAKMAECYVVVPILGISVRGSAEFIAATRKAMELLKGAGCLGEAPRYLARIQEAPISGVCVYEQVFYVAEPSWRSAPTWYASSIVHEVCHSRMHQEALAAREVGQPETPWWGADAERACMRDQIDALRRMGAEPYMVHQVESSMTNPTHQGDGSLHDYLRRWW